MDLSDLIEPEPIPDVLDMLLAESMELVQEDDRMKRARKRLAEDKKLSPTEREELAAMVNRYDELRTWNTIAQVALVHVQPCGNCGTRVEMFMGWMQEQEHRTQKGTRRLVAGLGAVRMPLRIEHHHLKARDQCAKCLPAFIRARQAIVPYVMQRKKETKNEG